MMRFSRVAALGLFALATSVQGQSGTGWVSQSEFEPPFHIVADGQDLGARFADLNGDGKVDFLYHRWFSGQVQKGAYLSTGSGWQSAPAFEPPFHIVGDGKDMGARLVDVNGDGLVDFVYHRYYTVCSGSPICGVTQKGAYLNTGSGWQFAPEFAPPYHIVVNGLDTGVRFADFNGDGRADFIYYRYFDGGQIQKGAYLSTDSGWQYSEGFVPPFHIVGDNKDMGVRIVDADSDGRMDFLYNRYYTVCSGSPLCGNSQTGAYLSTGTGWRSESAFRPPFHIVVNGLDTGARFADVDGDGWTDFLYYRYFDGGQIQKGAYLNTGAGWQYSEAFVPPFHIVGDNKDMGVRLVDVDRDGRVDFLYNRYYTVCSGSPLCGNSQTGAYLSTDTGWAFSARYVPRYHIVVNGQDTGVRFADVTGDGLDDYLYYRWFNNGQIQKGAYINTPAAPLP